MDTAVRLRLLSMLGALSALLLLTGCGGGEDTTDSVAAPEQNVEVGAPAREVIRNADLSLRVEDVRESVNRVESIAAQAGGRIASEEVVSTGDSLYASITARIPADRLDPVVSAVSELGEVTALNIIAEDVTAQGADLDARIEALEASIARLRQLLAAAETTKDLIDIEGELTTRQADLDSLVAQRAALSDLVALSTLIVSISPRSDAAAWTPPGFVAGLESGWNALRTVTTGLVTLAGFLLPFAIVLAVVATVITAPIVVLRRRRSAQHDKG